MGDIFDSFLLEWSSSALRGIDFSNSVTETDQN